MSTTDTTTGGCDAQLGALVDVTILGVRVAARDSYALTVADAESREIGVPHQMLGATVTPSVVQTLAGDVWGDRDGDLWFAVQESADAAIQLISPGADAFWDAADLARELGPLRLLYRPAGTAATAPPAAAVPVPRAAETDPRAALIEALRAAAQYLEDTPQLVVSRHHSFSVSWHVDEPADVAAAATAMSVALSSSEVGTAVHHRALREFGRGEIRVVNIEDLPVDEPTPGGDLP